MPQHNDKRISAAERRNLKVGDTIRFRTWTREGNHHATRKVVEISEGLGVGVRFNTWNPFWLKENEIVEVVEKAENNG